ncbi:unnamed protein product [Ectocarpus sp. CCAP 1310/34]|nr:unnamed protein product [Ectocarpus sp. CCAP 1310/34]
MQKHVTRMGRQLKDPTVKTTWKTYPEVMRRVEDVVASMAPTRRYRDKFGPQQQHGVVEPKKSNVATLETAHDSPEQPATSLQRQQQAAIKSHKSTLAAAVPAHANPEQPATAHQRKQQGAVEPKMSFITRLALRSDASTAEHMSAPAMVLFFFACQGFGPRGEAGERQATTEPGPEDRLAPVGPSLLGAQVAPAVAPVGQGSGLVDLLGEHHRYSGRGAVPPAQ